MAINDDVRAGETVSAVLTNVKTGEKRVVGDDAPRYKIEIKVTDLRTGEVHEYEAEK